MGADTLTVRLFVSTQTYDIPCDPQQPAKWLLVQAKNIQRSSRSGNRAASGAHGIQDELEVLYNRTRRVVIDLAMPIGMSIEPMDVIDARTLLQTPDTTANSAMFPWLRSYPNGLQPTDENMNSANGLFFQQLYAYTLIGRRTPRLASQRQQQQKQEDFLNLLKTYVVGSFEEPKLVTSFADPHQRAHPAPYHPRPSTPPGVSALHGSSTPARRASEVPAGSVGLFGSKPAPVQPRRHTEFPHDRDPDAGPDANGSEQQLYAMERSRSHPVSPSSGPSLPPPIPIATGTRRSVGDNVLDEMENVFDIVFKQQSIGLKLGLDETKQYAVVKECFEGTEAKRYPEIQSGVVILAVNGQEVSGLGLSRVLYRLREASRPVVVRFGRIRSHTGASDADRAARTGTWG